MANSKGMGMPSNWNLDLTGWFMPGAPKSAKQAGGCMLARAVLMGAVTIWFAQSRFGPGAKIAGDTKDMYFALAMFLLASITFTAAVPLMRRRRAGVIFAWIASILSLPFFPGGSFLAIFTIVGLVNDDTKNWLDQSRQTVL
jgi:hypothetical protein